MANEISWLEPDLDSESHQADIAFAADDTGIDEDELYDALKDGKCVPLTLAMWRRIENSDSLGVETLTELLKSHKARRDAKGKGKKARDLFHEFVDGEVSAPIVIKRADGGLYLVNGNTRLGLARLLKVKEVYVWLADASEIDE